MNNSEKFSRFLKAYEIEKPVSDSETGKLHLYSLWEEYKRWARDRKFNGCNHTSFLYLFLGEGFEITSEQEMHVLINKDKHKVYADIIPYKSRFGTPKPLLESKWKKLNK